MIKPGEIIELSIEKLTYGGGRGLGRHQGFVVFVPFTLPGETIKCQITESKKNFAQGEVLEILTPSPNRQTPPCPHFTQCGGCQWQHVPYQMQINTKTQLLNGFFRKLKKQDGSPLTIKHFEPSPKTYGYRNRIQLQWTGQHFGYFKPKSHDLVKIDQCLLAEEPINEYLSSHKNNGPKKQRIELAITPEGELKSFTNESKIAKEKLFSQVNTDQNHWLTQQVVEYIGSHPKPYFYDLYCGQGNFAVEVAQKFPEMNILGVDISKPNIHLGQQKVREDKIKNLELIAQSVDQFLLSKKAHRESIVLVDPPRSGLDPQIIQSLLKLKPELLIYISCNPATLARDLEMLTQNSGFKIIEAQGVDMFPQTDHIESICLLKS